MSKSIYEEALEIMTNSILPRESNKTNKLKVIKALKQAHKQTELYKELSKLKDDVIHSVMFGKDYEHLRVEILKIEQQIKELENE